MALRIGPTCGGRRTTRVGGRARSLLPGGPACTKVSAVGPEVRVRDNRETRCIRQWARNLWQSPRRDVAPLRAGVLVRGRGKPGPGAGGFAAKIPSVRLSTRGGADHTTVRQRKARSLSRRVLRVINCSLHDLPRYVPRQTSGAPAFDSKDRGRGQRKLPHKTAGCGFKRLLVPTEKTGPRSPRVVRGHTQRET